MFQYKFLIYFVCMHVGIHTSLEPEFSVSTMWVPAIQSPAVGSQNLYLLNELTGDLTPEH